MLDFGVQLLPPLSVGRATNRVSYNTQDTRHLQREHEVRKTVLTRTSRVCPKKRLAFCESQGGVEGVRLQFRKPPNGQPSTLETPELGVKLGL